MRIGIDIGGVVIGSPDGKDTSFFSNNYLATPMMRMAHKSLYILNQEHEIFFISKAGPKTAQKTLDWFRNRGLFWKLGIDESRLIFCRERSQKAPISLLLELDLFIDDRLDICKSMEENGVSSILFKDWIFTMDVIELMVEGPLPLNA